MNVNPGQLESIQVYPETLGVGIKMPIWEDAKEYRCPNCGHTEQEEIGRGAMGFPLVVCSKCYI